jgi:hypothetical protein
MPNVIFFNQQKTSIFKELINIIVTRPFGQGVGIFRAEPDDNIKRLKITNSIKTVCLIGHRA